MVKKTNCYKHALLGPKIWYSTPMGPRDFPEAQPVYCTKFQIGTEDLVQYTDRSPIGHRSVSLVAF